MTFCIRCGSLLERKYRRYGANPSEKAGLPYLISTLFPSLPRADMRIFRIVMAAGAVLTLALAGAGLHPLALTTAALLVPILSALYLWEVDVYEDQPWRVIALTVGGGVVSGIGLGLLSEIAFPGAGGREEGLLVSGVLLPVAMLLLAMAGPVVLLLPRRRFNDLLDGATFGAVSAAALGASMVLTRAISLLPGGLRPQGDSAEWVLRLAGLGIGAPVLAMCVTAGASASLWVRYRAPIADSSPIGPLARPVVAVPAAAALLVLSACTQVLLPGGLWLAVLIVLDVLALLWLRNVIHEGLRQQADERTEGPPAACKDCGARTPTHSYCGNCGMALAAQPKSRRRGRAALIAVPAAVIAGGLAATSAGAAIARPAAILEPCLRGEACGSPPAPPQPLVDEEQVAGEALGWTGVYDPLLFDLESREAEGYDLVAKEAETGARLRVRVRVSEGSDVEGALAAERERVSTNALGLVDESDPTRRIAGPMIGYREARAAQLVGTVDTPQGPGDGLTEAILAATDGTITATVTLSAQGRNDDRRRDMLGVADLILQGFRWSAPAGDVSASLLLRPRRGRALTRRAADPAASPLGAAQIGHRYGPSAATLRRVRKRVRAAGLRPGAVPPQRTTMRVSGAARAIERAFGTRLVHLRPGIHRPLQEPSVPHPLARDVLAVTGLDTRPLARPAAFPAGGLRPLDARRAYNMEGLAGRGVLGAGETIAVLSLDSFHDSDVEMYDRIVGVDSGPVERIPVNGGTTVGTDSEEVNLDLDVIRGLVPRAQLLNYETRNRAGAFGDIMDRIVADGRARIVSISWGRCELTVPEAERARDDAAFRAAAAAGITVFVASGDSGAYECERFDRDDQRLSVSWPAASQYVIAVGGTTLRLDSERRRLEEAGWESVLSNAGAGGGVAGSEPQPDWQRDSSIPGVRNEHSTGRRQVPDVAAASDFRTGWFAVVDGEERHFGGTSAAAPFWATVAATLRESLRARKLPFPRSFGNFIYNLAERPGSAAFHDVTVGGNRFFDATAGWDYVTGLGTPDVERLVAEAIRLQRATER